MLPWSVARTPTLSYKCGTLILHPPPKGQSWLSFVTWDDRIERFRLPAHQYRPFLEAMRAEDVTIEDKAGGFQALELSLAAKHEPYKHQLEAKAAWVKAGRCGVVVLPTAAGKTYLAQLCMEATPRSTLIVVPTLDLLHQWYADLEAAFPDVEIGLLGGGSKDRTPLLVSTYDSAAIYAEDLEHLSKPHEWLARVGHGEAASHRRVMENHRAATSQGSAQAQRRAASDS